jgi:pimeloyl-ACP methyl ester carboxylesterase
MVATRVAEKYVDLSHGKTRYLESGSGHPTILLHGVGFTSGADNWEFNMGPLGEKLHCYAPDFVGWGKGDRLDLEYSFAYLVDFIREFQDALGIEHSNIVGHSMGGWVSVLFAYESPNRVDKLVLVSPGGLAPRTLHSMTNFKPPTKEEIKGQLEKRVKAPGVDYDAMADRELAKAQIPGAVEAYQKILNHMNVGLTRQRYNTIRRLPKIKAPTLVVWGTEDGTNSYADMAQQTTDLLPNGKLATIQNCDHFIPTERPDDFNRALLDFLP